MLKTTHFPKGPVNCSTTTSNDGKGICCQAFGSIRVEIRVTALVLGDGLMKCVVGYKMW